jgi:hypothetical protein
MDAMLIGMNAISIGKEEMIIKKDLGNRRNGGIDDVFLVIYENCINL